MADLKQQQRVAVSYSWNEERRGASPGTVLRFCERMRTLGVQVVRDVDELRHGQCISEFMRSIGASDYLCVFLSEGYLKSPNCMYELLVAWQRSKDNPDELRDRMKVWVMPGADISTTERRLEYLTYWKRERDRVIPLIEQHATDGLAAAELEAFRRIRQFADSVSEILYFVSDTLGPRSIDEFEDWVRSEFQETGADERERVLSTVYQNTVHEAEELIKMNETLRVFLEQNTTGLLRNDGSIWKLPAKAVFGAFDVLPHLKNIADALPLYSGTRTDWEDLGDFTAGITVLSIDGEWVLRERQLVQSTAIEYPALKETLSFGGGRHANFLHLIASALADGRARLERVFGRPDECQIPDLPAVRRGISEDDIQKEVKLHLIRYVLAPDDEIDEGDDEQIELLFADVNDVFTAALHDEHRPYVATGKAFKKSTELIRKQLEVRDLLLIHPSGRGRETELLNDHIRVLRFLCRIFDSVQVHAPF